MTETTSSHQEFRRVLVSGYLGNTIDFYDFLLYTSAASLVFGPVFFTGLGPLAATVAAYGTFAAGYVARPIAGAVLGHLGDRLGRKHVLTFSTVLMGSASMGIGLIPSPALIGSWAAVILVLLRICQGIALGGEWAGATILALEHSTPRWRGAAAAVVNAGGPSGALLGTLAMAAAATLPTDQFLAWGWRVPFLLSALLLVVGLFIRLKVTESPVFRAAAAQVAADRRPPIVQVLRRPGNLVRITLGCSASFAMHAMFATFAISYATDTGTDRQQVLLCFGAATFVNIFCVAGCGLLSDRIGRRATMLIGFGAFIAALSPILRWLGSGDTGLVFAAFLTGLCCQALTFGPMAAFIAEQFSTRVRYTGSSLGYQLAALIGGGICPVILISLYSAFDRDVRSVYWFQITVCLVSVAVILLSQETRERRLEDQPV